MKIVPKGWGYEKIIHNSDGYCGKLLHVEKDKRCSLHFHVEKHETFYINSGQVRMKTIWGGKPEERIMNPGDILVVPPGLVHQFTALEDTDIFEFSTEDFDYDSYRIEKGD